MLSMNIIQKDVPVHTIYLSSMLIKNMPYKILQGCKTFL